MGVPRDIEQPLHSVRGSETRAGLTLRLEPLSQVHHACREPRAIGAHLFFEVFQRENLRGTWPQPRLHAPSVLASTNIAHALAKLPQVSTVRAHSRQLTKF